MIEPRLTALIRNAKGLRIKTTGGKKGMKTQKIVGGVKVRLAWAHSATEISSDPAGLVLVDEIDRMPDDIGDGSNPKEAADARHSTYPDGRTVVVSTPTTGSVKAQRHPDTGLFHWELGEPSAVQSPIWALWQEGTRHEWAVPCPVCGEYFIPRWSLLYIPDDCTPERAAKEARLQCTNGHKIEEKYKPEMNSAGVFLAPGQYVEGGEVRGPQPASSTFSCWISGLMSPWKSFGDRAEGYVKALNSGESTRIQSVLNLQGGELYQVLGAVREWEEIQALAGEYKYGEVNDATEHIFMAVDVGKSSLFYVIRGWGEGKSWLIDEGELVGDSALESTWERVAEFKDYDYSGHHIERVFIDTGYRPEPVYAFCYEHKGWAYAVKGQPAGQPKPIRVSEIDIGYQGKVLRGGLQLWHLDSNFFKTWVQDQYDKEPRTWFLPSNISEEYCKEQVAEVKIVKPNGGVLWVRMGKHNHRFDCEYLCYAVAYSLKVHRGSGSVKTPGNGTKQHQTAQPVNSWLGNQSGWFNRR
jgi:phage terminase large subunit GpA-like protein